MVARRALVLLAVTLLACEREPRDPSDYPACPPDTDWDGARCVANNVVCPEGSSWAGGSCAPVGAAPAADPVVGAFAVTGTRPDGAAYVGSAQIAALAKGGPYKLTWTLNGNTFSGIGSRRGDVLSVGWSDEKDYGVVDYVAKGDGVLDGVWYDATSNAPGRERLTGGLSNLAGVYAIEKASSPGGEPYTGTCDLAVTGELHTLIWHVGKDTFRGLGVREGDVLSVGFSTAKSSNFGVVQYKIAGDTLVGRWAEWSQKLPTLGRETLTRS